MKSTNQIVCEFVAAHPLCFTKDVAAHIGQDTDHTAKIMNRLEITDHLRMPTKVGHRNRWIVGANTRFHPALYTGQRGNGGGRHYPTNGDIDRKRVVTVAATAEDALALIANGYKKMRVL